MRSARLRDIEDVLFDLETLLDEVNEQRESGHAVEASEVLDRASRFLFEAETTNWPPIGTKPSERLDMYLAQVREAASEVRCVVTN